MNKTLLAITGVALALSLTGATAYAADHRDHRGDRAQMTRQHDDGRFDRRGTRQRSQAVQQQQHQNWRPQRNDGRGDWQNNNRPRLPAANNNWRNNNKWAKHQHLRRNFNSPRRFRIGHYHAPRNHQYRRWSYGERLPFVYLARTYWLTNAIVYGLLPPPPGLIWVRFGPDALLVDQYTGEIVQVRYNVFY